MAGGGDMLPRSKLQQQEQQQQRCFTFELKNPMPAINFLRQRMVNGEPCPDFFINEADPYSAAPEELIRDLRHAPGKGGASWYLMSLANYCRSAEGGSTANRKREVHGGNGEVCGSWHSDKVKQDVRDADRRIVGYTRTLYYKIKKQATGWCMNEVWLEKRDGADQHLVLCKLYRLNSKRYAQASTAAGSDSEAAPVTQRPVSDDDSIAGAEAVKEEARDGGESPVTVDLPSMGNTATNLLLLAAEKAVSCDLEKACGIDEFVMVKELYLTTTDALGLDRSILSGPMNQLELRLRHIAMDKELTPPARDRIVSCGESMSQIIFFAYLEEVGKMARQAFNSLQKIGVNVDDQISKRACKVTNVSLVVDDSGGNRCVRVLYSASLEDGFVSKVEGEENEFPVPVISSSAASSPGVKRKGDQDHPEAAPSTRQKRTDTDIDGQEEINRMSFSENVPMPAGGECVGDLACGVTMGVPQVQPEQHGVAEVAEGGSGPSNALDELERNLFSQDDPMQAGGDIGEYPDGYWAGILEDNDNLDNTPTEEASKPCLNPHQAL